MADCESKSEHRKMKKMKTKKRKQHSSHKEEEGGCKRPSKSHRTEQLADEVEEPIIVPESEEAIKLQDNSPWRNLQLILVLQNNSIPLPELVINSVSFLFWSFFLLSLQVFGFSFGRINFVISSRCVYDSFTLSSKQILSTQVSWGHYR